MASPLNPEEQASVELCKLCLHKRAKYVCPRCGTPYCSVSCYKSESHQDCSEAFYQEWVEEELKGCKVSLDGKKRMIDILNKVSKDVDFDEELDSDDDASLPDLAERLEGIDINDTEAVWEKLSETEQAAFKDLIKTGDIANLIPNWEPWWCQRVEKPLVIELKEENKSQELKEILTKCPPIYDKVTTLSEMTKMKPSLSVSFDLINILGSYSITVRYFSGDHFDFPEEAATIIYKLSKSLVSPQKFSNADIALDAVGLEALIYDAIEVTEKDVILMKEDVKKIMDGPSFSESKFYMLAALSDMHRLFSCYGKKCDKNKGKFSNIFPNVDLDIEFMKREHYKTTLKRLKYFLSWVLEYGEF